jgi:hypothetical protein
MVTLALAPTTEEFTRFSAMTAGVNGPVVLNRGLAGRVGDVGTTEVLYVDRVR